MNLFPANANAEAKGFNTLESQIFGNRFLADQTLYEYLIEFLLVFASPKHGPEQGVYLDAMKFHGSEEESMSYFPTPKMGLRRFVFFDKSRKDKSIKDDELAYEDMINSLCSSVAGASGEDEKKEIVYGLQDLLHGYSLVVRNRSWCAQALLPLCDEMLFCGAMPNKKEREHYSYKDNKKNVDKYFDFDKRNFLARGGEVYYLHLLQSLANDSQKKDELEALLNDLLRGHCKSLSDACRTIQSNWDAFVGGSGLVDPPVHLTLSAIPAEAYTPIGTMTADELINYLKNEIDPINRVEVLGKGVVYQIMRMMNVAVAQRLGKKPCPWIVDMKGSRDGTIKRLAAENFKQIEDDFFTAINLVASENELDEIEKMKRTNNARKNSIDIFRTKGKELQCIIPSRGPDTRFSLSEDVVRFLVLSILKPNQKMTFDTFLDELYEHYGLIIGPAQYGASLGGSGSAQMWNTSFAANALAFQNFLKETGFLRELSDATSIVENPYEEIKLGEVDL